MARPLWTTIMTEEKIKELDWYFSIWLTDEEACLMANIWRTCFYDYCSKNPEYKERKEILKRKPLIKAKSNIVKELNEQNIDVSKWYAERKGKDEFSLKQEVDQKTTVTEIPATKEELEAELARIEEETKRYI